MGKDQAEAEAIKNEIRERILSLKDSYFKADPTPVSYRLSQTRELQGHFQKVYAIDWAGNNSDSLVSASQDGKLIIWNGESTNKTNAIPLKSCWVMACSHEKRGNQQVASGGLNNVCSVYKLKEHEIGASVKPDQELEGHQGYISSCSFLDENNVVTSSGDGSCRVWDTNTGTCINYFTEHNIDVMSVSPCPTDSNIFISGSVDKLCKLWDIRVKSSAATFRQEKAPPKRFVFGFDEEEFEGEEVGGLMYYEGHESDVNSVAFFPDGKAFVSGSDDASCRLWDIRCHQQINVYQNHTVLCGITSVDFSKSGRLIFSGYDDNSLLCWDTLHNEGGDETNVEPIQSFRKHEAKVSTLSVQSGGKALATGSWDTLIKIFA